MPKPRRDRPPSKNQDKRRREARRVGNLLRDFVDRDLSITPLITLETTNGAILRDNQPPENPVRLRDRLAQWFSKEDPCVDPELGDRLTYEFTVPLKKADERDHRHFVPEVDDHSTYAVTVSLEKAGEHDHRHFVLWRPLREHLEQYGVRTNFQERLGFSGIEIMAPPEEDADGTQTILIEKGSVLYILDRRPAANEELSVFEFWVVPDCASPNDTAYLGVRLVAHGFTKDDGDSKRRLNQTLARYFRGKEEMRAASRKSHVTTRS